MNQCSFMCFTFCLFLYTFTVVRISDNQKLDNNMGYLKKTLDHLAPALVRPETKRNRLLSTRNLITTKQGKAYRPSRRYDQESCVLLSLPPCPTTLPEAVSDGSNLPC